MSLNCENISKVIDITGQIDYDDKKPGGFGDSKKVSCGQNDGYSELKDKFDKHFSAFPESIIANIMCSCCKELKSIGRKNVSWKEYYECMRKKTDNKDLIEVLDRLIPKNTFSEYLSSN